MVIGRIAHVAKDNAVLARFSPPMADIALRSEDSLGRPPSPAFSRGLRYRRHECDRLVDIATRFRARGYWGIRFRDIRVVVVLLMSVNIRITPDRVPFTHVALFLRRLRSLALPAPTAASPSPSRASSTRSACRHCRRCAKLRLQRRPVPSLAPTPGIWNRRRSGQPVARHIILHNFGALGLERGGSSCWISGAAILDPPKNLLRRG